MICEQAGIARKTFYSHFDNKEGILAYLFKRDIIDPQHSMRELLPQELRENNIKLFTSKIYELVYDDREFWHKIVGPMIGVDDTFLRIASRAIYDFDLEILEERGRDLLDWKTDYNAYFLSTSQAMILQKWIADNYPVSADDLGQWYATLLKSVFFDMGE